MPLQLLEPPASPVRSNEEQFQEMEMLMSEGWKLDGNRFCKDQAWHSTLFKSGKPDRVFRTTRAFPKIVNIAGELK